MATKKKSSKYLSGRRIDPRAITGGESVADLVDETFLAYNAGRLREACQLFTRKMLEPDVTVGLSITGALTPAGLGISALIPLMRAGFVDWVITTGANLYHDTHFGIGLSLNQGNAAVSFTSSDGSKLSLFPCKAFAATFMPMDESPGLEV